MPDLDPAAHPSGRPLPGGPLARGVEALQDRLVALVAPADTAPDALPLRRAVVALGGGRGVLLASLPTLGFVVGNEVSGLRAGAVAGTAAGLVVLAERLATRSGTLPAVVGFLGLLSLVALALVSGDAETFFLPGILGLTVQSLGLVLTVAVRRPFTGAVARALGAVPADWRADPALVRLFVRQDVLWALVFAARAIGTAALVVADQTAALGALRLSGTPLYVLLVALCVRWARPHLAGRTA